MPPKVGLIFWTSLWRNMLIEEFDVCCLCKYFETVYAELSSPVTKKSLKMSLSAFTGRRSGITTSKRRAGHGNFNKHTECCGQWVFPAKSSFSYIWEINGGRWHGKLLFVQQPRTGKQIGNVVSALDAFARTNHNTNFIYVSILKHIYFVITHFIYFISYNCMRINK